MNDKHFKFVAVEVDNEPLFVGAYHITWGVWWKTLFPPAYWLLPLVMPRFRDMPVTGVSQVAIERFIHRLSQKEGIQFHLPCTREWDQLTKALRTTKGELTADDMLRQAWTIQNSGGNVRPVGTKSPTYNGIYDLMGNVWDIVRGDERNLIMRGGAANVTLDCIYDNTKGHDRVLVDHVNHVFLRYAGFRLVTAERVVVADKPTEDEMVHMRDLSAALARMKSVSERLVRQKPVQDMDEAIGQCELLLKRSEEYGVSI